jgi:hypothetical protein
MADANTAQPTARGLEVGKTVLRAVQVRLEASLQLPVQSAASAVPAVPLRQLAVAHLPTSC